MNEFLDTLGGAVQVVTLGGPVVALLLLMSLVAITIVLAKLFQFRRVRINDRRSARKALELYRDGNASAAMTSAATEATRATPCQMPGPLSFAAARLGAPRF